MKPHDESERRSGEPLFLYQCRLGMQALETIGLTVFIMPMLVLMVILLLLSAIAAPTLLILQAAGADLLDGDGLLAESVVEIMVMGFSVDFCLTWFFVDWLRGGFKQ